MEEARKEVGEDRLRKEGEQSEGSEVTEAREEVFQEVGSDQGLQKGQERWSCKCPLGLSTGKSLGTPVRSTALKPKGRRWLSGAGAGQEGGEAEIASMNKPLGSQCRGGGRAPASGVTCLF